jgi:Kef-type K+ transport system membrane component KefB
LHFEVLAYTRAVRSAVILFAACLGGLAAPAFAQPSDAGRPERRDAGPPAPLPAIDEGDAGARPRSTPDPDAGRPRVRRTITDAGAPDAGAVDAGITDAGEIPPDGGVALAADAGLAPEPPDPEEAQDDEAHEAEVESTPTGVVIRTILALLGLLALAYIAGHPRVQRVEEMLGVSQVVASGLPFFLLGAIAHHPAVGLLPDEVLTDLRPLLEFGLGWIGLLAGLQFHVSAIDKWPDGTGNLVGTLTFVPFVVIAGVAGAMIYLLDLSSDYMGVLRGAATIGAAGCLAAPIAVNLLSSSGLSERAVGVVRSVAIVDDVAGVLALALLSAFFRPNGGDAGWDLPGIGWLFVTLGMGLALGLLIYVVLRTAKTSNELTALLLGSIALAAGSAAFFSVSPIVICFIAGLVLANFPGRYHETMQVPLARLERPIYLIFLIVTGAIWRYDAWEGWLLLPAFILARIVGRSLAARIVRARRLLHQAPGEEEQVARAFVHAPLGALSIAIVVNVGMLYQSRALPMLITAVVGGALVSEVLMQLQIRFSRRSTPPTASQPPEPPPAPPDSPAPESAEEGS